MCTVSYISIKGKRFLTSNRDEHISRPSSLKPNEEIVNNCRVLFPKDPKAGGTWFAVNENGVTGVLLNGAFQSHVPEANYRLSRGLVLLNIISNAAPAFHFERIQLHSIEPFTIILLEHSQLLELRWDGMNKYRKELNPDENYIWSSVSLYDLDTIVKRENHFNAFISNQSELNEKSIIDFHHSDQSDSENGFIMNRNNLLKTFSITQTVHDASTIKMNHYDLLKEELHTILISPNTLIDQSQ
ncbi:MAG: hypothetical protein EYC69_08880 [Bacteroidetes bacterium]|nr:MAG: hypothetical protein EYC69_08880 [Bacteroidota bacterium]